MKKIYNIDGDLREHVRKAAENYKFQPILTKKLDSISGDFNEMTLLEIVLWKTNRYPEFTSVLIDDINSLRNHFSVDKAKSLLKDLLTLRGFDLPMASTVLRFACPDHFQIIDQRVFRFINEETDVFKKPYNNDKKVEMYFDYLNKLRAVCNQYDIPFSKSDRILYQLDKDLNGDYPINY
jgi:thermostable 8-oxoguanine DNA glycosylase